MYVISVNREGTRGTLFWWVSVQAKINALHITILEDTYASNLWDVATQACRLLWECISVYKQHLTYQNTGISMNNVIPRCSNRRTHKHVSWRFCPESLKLLHYAFASRVESQTKGMGIRKRRVEKRVHAVWILILYFLWDQTNAWGKRCCPYQKRCGLVNWEEREKYSAYE